MNQQTVLITGVAGFIGSSLAHSLLSQKMRIVGIDSFATNYSRLIKNNNISRLQKFKSFDFIEGDICNFDDLALIFEKYPIKIVIHLAALTGVRASLKMPKEYFRTNAHGAENVYKAAINKKVKKFIFASSSSIYGNNKKIPFTENHPLSPQSPYAESKRLAEQLIHSLHTKNGTPTTILRFFSVYGPRGRPDMAPYLFTQAAYTQHPISVFGDGSSARDYTYIDDVTAAIEKSMKTKDKWAVINIGNSSPVKLRKLIRIVEKETGHRIKIDRKPYNTAETFITYSDISRAYKQLHWKPTTSIEVGMKKFIEWFKMQKL